MEVQIESEYVAYNTSIIQAEMPPYSIMEEDDPLSQTVFNMSWIPYRGHLKVIETWEVTVKVVMYVIVILLAVFGNFVVMIIVWRNKRLRTTTNYYLVNLAVADLMVTFSCTWVHLVHDLTEGWVLGALFCKFNSFAQGECHYFTVQPYLFLLRELLISVRARILQHIHMGISHNSCLHT